MKPSAPITPDQIRMAAKAALAQIDPALAKLPKDHPLAAIAGDLRQLQSANDEVAIATDHALTRFLPEQLDNLRTVLGAVPVTLAFDPAGCVARLAAAGWAGAHTGDVDSRRPAAVAACGNSSSR